MALPAPLAVDAQKSRCRFDGFSANYCWSNTSPISHYTMKNLKVASARFELKAQQWDVRRPNPGPEIRADLEGMRAIQPVGIPLIVTIWWLPERLYTDPYEKTRSDHFRIIDPLKWDDLPELLSGYLIYARDSYGVDPWLSSFHEANIGVYVGHTPETHAYIIKRIGWHFTKLGVDGAACYTRSRDSYHYGLREAHLT